MKTAKPKKPKIPLQLEDVEAFNKQKLKIDKVYRQMDAIQEQLLEKYGVGEYEIVNPKGGFFRLTIQDNITALKAGERVFHSTGFSRYNFSLKEVKHARK